MSTDYVCPRCKYSTDKYGMKKHLNLKKICKAIDDKHDVSIDIFKEEFISKYNRKIKTETLRTQTHEDIKKYNLGNKNIIIHEFGAEDISHITDDIDFMKSCFINKKKGIIKYIMKKWFCKTNPKESTLRVADKICGAIEYYKRKKWVREQLDNKMIFRIMNNIMIDYQIFLEKNQVFDKDFLDDYMRDIGVALEMDLSTDYYDYEEDDLNKDHKPIVDKVYDMIRSAILYSC